MPGTEHADEFETDTPFSEVEEMEYAANLLEVADEAELNDLVGSLLNKAGESIGSVLNRPMSYALGGYLRRVISQAVPGIGPTVDGYLVPASGSAVGRRRGSPAGQMLGLELEGLSAEDQEFEIARRLVRLIGAAAQKAAEIAPGVDVHSATRQAALAAARKHAPGLLRGGIRLPHFLRQAGYDGEAAEPETNMEADAKVVTPFGEVQELELAAELMEVGDEDELDQFIGKLLKRAGQAGGAVLKTAIGQEVGGLIKGAIKKALPSAGAALGGDFTRGAGGAAHRRLAEQRGDVFGLDREATEAEDQKFEMARQVVRFAGSAATRAARMPHTVLAHAAARAAVSGAARHHLPELLRPLVAVAPGTNAHAGCGCSSNRSGRWVRGGAQIVVLDLFPSAKPEPFSGDGQPTINLNDQF